MGLIRREIVSIKKILRITKFILSSFEFREVDRGFQRGSDGCGCPEIWSGSKYCQSAPIVTSGVKVPAA